jgi:hypothetical protein
MIRIFINSFDWSVTVQLKAFMVDQQYLKTIRIVITQTEADAFKAGGMYALYRLKLDTILLRDESQLVDEWGTKYISEGCLVEKRDGCYMFTRYFYHPKHKPIPIPLPSAERLQELGLQQF